MAKQGKYNGLINSDVIQIESSTSKSDLRQEWINRLAKPDESKNHSEVSGDADKGKKQPPSQVQLKKQWIDQLSQPR